ncbi:hypothetical protein PACTADRAFT_50394 [Pachysolen tannophilus NRRL Y-2460]|uniref:Monopolar spindle protein 2 n=1 Tax=Pachysolen tannophilus NRRL Y-2460 TaxID=669874 RepID=A0A1E4TVC2_PACTA|nr:hypothetical protein PACTADRAFT_50394 [Pachysolen tannophilus NRRL Y-2460]
MSSLESPSSSILNRAWNLCSNSLNELPITKLLELIDNLELISHVNILDKDSREIASKFIENHKDEDLVITLNDFRPFFDKLFGFTLSEKINKNRNISPFQQRKQHFNSSPSLFNSTAPPKLNFNTDPTTNFVNAELMKLKRANGQSEDEIKFRDDVIKDLNEKNEMLSNNYKNFKTNNIKLQNKLRDNEEYLKKFEDEYSTNERFNKYKKNFLEPIDGNKIKNNDDLQLNQRDQLIIQLNDEIRIQNQLVKSLIKQNTELQSQKKNFSHKETFTTSFANNDNNNNNINNGNLKKLNFLKKSSSVIILNIRWIILFTFCILLILSALEFLTEYFGDNLEDKIDFFTDSISQFQNS